MLISQCILLFEQDGEIIPELPAEVLERIITRPEDLPEQVEKNIRKYKINLLRILEVGFT